MVSYCMVPMTGAMTVGVGAMRRSDAGRSGAVLGGNVSTYLLFRYAPDQRVPRVAGEGDVRGTGVHNANSQATIGASNTVLRAVTLRRRQT